MPAFVVGLTEAGVIARTVRSSLVEIMHEDYVRTARAKGLKERLVVLRHGLRNAWIPTVTIIGINMAAVLGGVVIVETVFAREGIGRLVVDSVLYGRSPSFRGGCCSPRWFSFSSIWRSTFSMPFFDPRIRYGSHRQWRYRLVTTPVQASDTLKMMQRQPRSRTAIIVRQFFKNRGAVIGGFV